MHICYTIFVLGPCHSLGSYLPDLILHQSCGVYCRKVAGTVYIRVPRLSSVNLIPVMLLNHPSLNTKLIGRTSGRRVGSFKQNDVHSNFGENCKEKTFTLIMFQNLHFQCTDIIRTTAQSRKCSNKEGLFLTPP